MSSNGYHARGNATLQEHDGGESSHQNEVLFAAVAGISTADEKQEHHNARESDFADGPSPPPYQETASASGLPDRYQLENGSFTQNVLTENTEIEPPYTVGDGRIKMHIRESGLVSNIMAQALPDGISLDEELTSLPSPSLATAIRGLDKVPCGKTVRLNIVMQVVGSRGDVQPFVALGKVLQKVYGHRVRLATHLNFQKFVEENDLEFFNIGGDPLELIAFMVKNPGLIPGMDSIKSGEIGKRRKEMTEILTGCWRSCFEAGNGISHSPDNIHNEEATGKPFVADVIIANPPSFAHIHCAEKMGIPLNIMFTMPWSPTLAFPHPLANVVSSTAGERRANFISYALVETFMWQGFGSIINRFREKTLLLDPISDFSGPGIISRLRVPHLYCWSPALIPKPRDWESHISVSGFCFLSHASDYTPEPDLAAFLAEGNAPVYIGFGSIVPDDPDVLTELIFSAIEKSGQRAIVSKGWGGLGTDSLNIPENVFMLGNVPHDWLFKRVACVVHHGGAGTTSAGIALGKPTVVVPFFGDQPFWGSMVAKAGAGPTPIPFKQLTADNLAAAIQMALESATVEAAKKLGSAIALEEGCEVTAGNFHGSLDFDTLRCDLDPGRKAIWRVTKTDIKLSAMAATILTREGLLNFNDLKQYRSREYHSEQGPKEPISGGLGSILGKVGNLMVGMLDIPIDVAKSVAIKENPRSTPHINSKDLTEGDRNRGQSLVSPSSTSGRSTPIPKTISRQSIVSLNSAEAQVSLSLQTSSRPDIPDDGDSHSRTDDCKNGSKDKKGRKDKLKGKITAGKAFGFGFYKELSGSDSVARSAFLNETTGSISNHPEGSIGSDAALGAGKGLGRIAAIGMRTPLDFTMGVTNGFRNAPKLYGDTTVRPATKVTSFNSGLSAASKEFGYGVYDGVTGLVTQPVRGAKKEGVSGFFKGFAKGVGGAVLKPGAALFGIPGYTFKGIHQEIQNHFGSGLQSYIIAVRTAEGWEDCEKSTPEERLDIVNRWQSAAIEERKIRPRLVDRWRSVHESRKQFRQQTT